MFLNFFSNYVGEKFENLLDAMNCKTGHFCEQIV